MRARTRDRTLAWATDISDEGVLRPTFIEDLDKVEIVITEGVSPLGVEWTRLSFVDIDGVEWSRTSFRNPSGGQRLVVAAVEPDGVKVSHTIGTRADGTEYVASSFVAASGDAFVRRAPGRQIRGVEWTRAY
jgi:hypothetical protein